MTPALEISRLSYSVPGLDILKQLELVVSAGHYCAIAGVNGAGKSTLIKLILDLIRPSPGASIRLFGHQNQDSQCRDQLVYLPEKFDIKKNLTGRQYLDFIGAVYHQHPGRETIAALAERLDFPPDRLDSRASEYSKGMVQKLGLVSCFMLERRMLILDEPLSGLDPRARYHFKELMREQKSLGRTVLYSTHLLADAEDLCDQFGILHGGEFLFTGSPQECLAHFESDTLEQAYMQCIQG